jgi:hypothetical protein
MLVISLERARLGAAMIEKLEFLKNWIKVGISGVDIADSDEDWKYDQVCGVGPYLW